VPSSSEKPIHRSLQGDQPSPGFGLAGTPASQFFADVLKAETLSLCFRARRAVATAEAGES